MAGLKARLPFSLSGRAASAGAATYGLTDIAYHVALGGIPFLLGPDQDHPYIRGLAEMKKEQFDAEREPGEQTLANWWLRSQSTFLGGEGLTYQDPDMVQSANLRNRHAIQYGHSVGVDPWTNGQMSLLRQTVQRSSAGTYVQGYNDGTDRLWIAAGTALSSDDGSASTSITWGGSGTILSLATDGSHYFVADSVGIWSAAGTAAGSKIWNTASSNVTLGWAKGRLMAGIGPSVYDLSGTGPALPAAKFTHLNPAWTWTSFGEGTDSIYASGYAGSTSAIYKFVLDNTGAVPTLASGGIITCSLPQGEVVYSLLSYLGTYVGIATNRGFRVGQIDTNGDISYGPLLVAPAGGCRAVAAYDRWFWVTASNDIDGMSGLWRIDLGQPITDDSTTASVVRYAYATDLQAHVPGVVTSVTNFGNSDRMAFCVAGEGTYLEDASVLEATGYLETGRIRFNTLEPKVYKFLSVKTPAGIMGTVGASIEDPGGGETPIITVSEGASTLIEDVVLGTPTAPVEWIKLKVTLGRSSGDATQGGVVNGWQIKAQPGVVRQRLFTLPLLCYDFEKDSSGQDVGYRGRTWDRLQAFEQLAQAGDTISFQDLLNDVSTLVQIDQYEFRQIAAPGANGGSLGGILTVQLRTMADVITS